MAKIPLEKAIRAVPLCIDGQGDPALCLSSMSTVGELPDPVVVARQQYSSRQQ